jgi:hypothetical protein
LTAELPAPPSLDLPASRPGRIAAAPTLPAPKVEPEQAIPESSVPRLQTLLTPAERRRLERSIQARRNEIQQLLARAQSDSQTTEQREAVERVHSFLALSDQAAQRGDLRLADGLSSRALSLARGMAQ